MTKPLNLKEFLPYRLSIVTNKVSRNLGSMYSDKFDLSIAEWRVMAVLGQDKDLSADEVCLETEMDKVSVSRAVTKLLGKKQIVRKFSNQDRRRSILRLSKSGLAAYDQIVPLAKDYENDLLAGLSRQEQRQLDQLLDKLNKRAIYLGNIDSS
ncbi:MAG: DNA-binding MarR family transcriptional regulator [Gammaproteobacteria bacterium]|jgi:DNA-binding MarR family transcriptional regulator